LARKKQQFFWRLKNLAGRLNLSSTFRISCLFCLSIELEQVEQATQGKNCTVRAHTHSHFLPSLTRSLTFSLSHALSHILFVSLSNAFFRITHSFWDFLSIYQSLLCNKILSVFYISLNFFLSLFFS
jgi:hypothetical protein